MSQIIEVTFFQAHISIRKCTHNNDCKSKLNKFAYLVMKMDLELNTQRATKNLIRSNILYSVQQVLRMVFSLCYTQYMQYNAENKDVLDRWLGLETKL